MSSVIIFAVLVIVGLIVKKVNEKSAARNSTNPNPRMQRLVERMQAQQRGNQPTRSQGQSQGKFQGQLQGQSTQPPQPQFQPPQFQSPQYQPGQFQVPPAPIWSPPNQSPPAGRGTASGPKQSKPPKGDFDKRVRELMASGNEVAAVRLLCDEQDMGIIEAQSYARALVANGGRAPRRTGESAAPRGNGENAPERPESAARPDPDEAETRYVGSAAFAESVFSTDPDENVWASGWVEKPEQDDRTDIDELWQTVQNNGRPAST
jgi:hypothetical protein